MSQINELMFNIQTKRNLEGIELEKQNNVDSAILLYELNIKERFIGSHPYNRLATIYRKQKLYFEEKRVLEIAIDVFQNDVDEERGDRDQKLQTFSERLIKVNKLLELERK